LEHLLDALDEKSLRFPPVFKVDSSMGKDIFKKWPIEIVDLPIEHGDFP